MATQNGTAAFSGTGTISVPASKNYNDVGFTVFDDVGGITPPHWPQPASLSSLSRLNALFDSQGAAQAGDIRNLPIW